MSVTLWIDTDREETVELGPTLAVYGAFAEMVRAVGGDEERQSAWPDLSGVLSQCESQEDADPAWLADVAKQASRLLRTHGNDLSDLAYRILVLLAHQA